MIPQEPVYPDSGNYGDAFDDMPWEYLEWLALFKVFRMIETALA